MVEVRSNAVYCQNRDNYKMGRHYAFGGLCRAVLAFHPYGIQY